MEKYNKVYAALWVILSAIILAFMLVFLLNPLREIYDEMGIWLCVCFIFSELTGFALSSLIIDHIRWAYRIHTIFIFSARA